MVFEFCMFSSSKYENSFPIKTRVKELQRLGQEWLMYEPVILIPSLGLFSSIRLSFLSSVSTSICSSSPCMWPIKAAIEKLLTGILNRNENGVNSTLR